MDTRKIPQEAIIRLGYYLRALNYLFRADKKVVSSRSIAAFLKTNPHQLRKDLSYFGQFGKKGVGYDVEQLIGSIRDILGINKTWYACIVGFGNLAKALSFYQGFNQQGIVIRVGFDVSAKKINKRFGPVQVYPLNKMKAVIKREGIKIGIITVPEEAAQDVADRLVASGIKAILNFAPFKLNLPHQVIVKDVELAGQLFYLTYNLKLLET